MVWNNPTNNTPRRDEGKKNRTNDTSGVSISQKEKRTARMEEKAPPKHPPRKDGGVVSKHQSLGGREKRWNYIKQEKKEP